MASALTYISEEEVKSALKWDELFSAIEGVLSDVSAKSTVGDSIVVQPARGFMHVPHKKGVLLTMPGYSERKKVLACKLVTSFPENPTRFNLPSILASIVLLDSDTGNLKAVVAATTITEWRTACASAVATKHLKPGSFEDRVLAVLGSGKQGRIHAIAFHHFFKFKKIHLWNRTRSKAEAVAKELRERFNVDVTVYQTVRECAKDADVIVTATSSPEPIVAYDDIKPEAMINAVGASVLHHTELHADIYERADIYADSVDNARVELKGLLDAGFALVGEVGEVINGSKQLDRGGRVRIFHSLGLAVEDAVSAALVWESKQSH